MSEPINDGGPAFPRTVTIDDGIDRYREIKRDGMSLRDYLAAQALQGYLAGRNNSPHETPISYKASRVACDCYAYADAMLLARLTKPE